MRRAAAYSADIFLGLLRGRGHKRGERGQGLVEFAFLLPVFMLLLLGMLEFGFVFDQNLTLEYATREGARVGSALANDGGPTGCATVDNQIMAAVQRVLLSPGSRVKPEAGMTVLIWKADATGARNAATTNTWTFFGVGLGPTVDGQAIAFKPVVGSQNWDACSRSNGTPVDSIGVSLIHTYSFQTPLAGILKFFGGASAGQLTMSDKTVMALNPTN